MLRKLMTNDPACEVLLGSDAFWAGVDPRGPHPVVPLFRSPRHDAYECVVTCRRATWREGQLPINVYLLMATADYMKLPRPDPGALDIAKWAVMTEEAIARENPEIP